MSNKELSTNYSSFIMENLKTKLLYLLVCLSINLCAQTEAQIAEELKNLGIKDMFDVNTELARRGMSEAEARKMARVYGIDYDMYLEKYILNLEDNNENNEVTYVDSSTVSKLDYTLPIIKTVDTLLIKDSVD